MNQNVSYGKLCSLYYDLTKHYAPADEVAFYAAFLHKNAVMLEAMAGNGRLMIPLLEQGFAVHGVDNSESMLEYCHEKCARLGIMPTLYHQHLESLCVPHRYDVVSIAVGSFQLLINRDDALRALKNIQKHMNSDGDLLIDTFIPDSTIANQRVATAVPVDQHTVVELTKRYVYTETEKMLDAYCQYTLIKNGVTTLQEDELLQITWYTDDELKALLECAGFTVVAIYEKTFQGYESSRIFHAQIP